jgi:hypothetical protein
MNMWIELEEQLQALLISKTDAGEFSTCLSGRITSVENFFHTCQVFQEMNHAGWQKSPQYALTLRNEWKKNHKIRHENVQQIGYIKLCTSRTSFSKQTDIATKILNKLYGFHGILLSR